MKIHSAIHLVICLLLSQVVMAQQNTALSLSDNYPEAGKNYAFSYDAAAKLSGADSMSFMLYYFTDPEKRVSKKELSAIKAGDKWNGKFLLPADAKAFFISIKDSKQVQDKNDGKGYPFYVYKNRMPVMGSKAYIATLYVFDNPNAGTTKNLSTAENLLSEEFSTNPSSRQKFAQTYYNLLLNSKDEAKTALLVKTLYDSLNTNNEKNYDLALNFFYQLKKNKTVDSIRAAAKEKFPAGSLARMEMLQTVYNAKTAAEKEKVYKAWLLRFPLAKHKNSTILNDYALNSVATAFADEGDIKKALAYSSQFTTPAWRGEGYAGTAMHLMKDGTYLNEALMLFKKAAANSLAFKTTRKNEDGADFAALGYGSYNNSIAKILYRQKKYKEALPYAEIAYKEYKEPRADINTHYAKILSALGRESEAFDKIDELVKTGQANNEVMDGLKELYVKRNGSDKGFDAYLAEAKRQMVENIIKELPRRMVKFPSKNFTLKDVNGNTISLADYKGKVVVVDFWATWCGPCKASFPAMQMAVNKFKDTADVKFLFVHTWERGDAGVATTEAKKYVEDNHYTFQVLMDTKDPETGINKAVDSYGINGIPTKLVIDKNGNVRFSLTGFSGGNDAAVEELSAMIKMAKNS